MKYQALDFLRTLTKEEYKKLSLFVSSPYFTKKKKLAELLKVLAKFHPYFENENLTNKFIKSKMGNIDDSTIRNYFSDLNILLLKFMRYLNLENQNHEQFIVTLEELENRNLVNIYEREKIKYVNFIKNPNLEFTPTDYFYLYRFNLVEKNLLVGTNCIKKGKNSQICEYEIKIESLLTKYYLLESLKSWIQCKMHKNYFNLKFKKQDIALYTFFQEGNQTEHLFESIINEERDNRKKRILKTYFLIYQCYKENQSTEDLYKILNSLHKAINFLPPNINGYEYQYILSVSRNAFFELRRRNVHGTTLKRKFDELYLESYLRYGGDSGIPVQTFSAILLESLIDLNLTFAKKIFKKYQKHTSDLMNDFHENCLKFFEHFRNRNFTTASEFFLRLKSKDINTKRKLKLLQIYLQYEMGNYEYCITLSENFKKFFYNHKNEHSNLFSEYMCTLGNAFTLLCNIKLSYNKDKIAELERINFPATLFLQKKREEILQEYSTLGILKHGQIRKNFL